MKFSLKLAKKYLSAHDAWIVIGERSTVLDNIHLLEIDVNEKELEIFLFHIDINNNPFGCHSCYTNTALFMMYHACKSLVYHNEILANEVFCPEAYWAKDAPVDGALGFNCNEIYYWNEKQHKWEPQVHVEVSNENTYQFNYIDGNKESSTKEGNHSGREYSG